MKTHKRSRVFSVSDEFQSSAELQKQNDLTLSTAFPHFDFVKLNNTNHLLSTNMTVTIPYSLFLLLLLFNIAQARGSGLQSHLNELKSASFLRGLRSTLDNGSHALPNTAYLKGKATPVVVVYVSQVISNLKNIISSLSLPNNILLFLVQWFDDVSFVSYEATSDACNNIFKSAIVDSVGVIKTEHITTMKVVDSPGSPYQHSSVRLKYTVTVPAGGDVNYNLISSKIRMSATSQRFNNMLRECAYAHNVKTLYLANCYRMSTGNLNPNSTPRDSNSTANRNILIAIAVFLFAICCGLPILTCVNCVCPNVVSPEPMLAIAVRINQVVPECDVEMAIPVAEVRVVESTD